MRCRFVLARSLAVFLSFILAIALAPAAPAQSAPTIAARILQPGSRTAAPIMLGAPARSHATVRPDGTPTPQVDPPKFSLAPGVYSSAQSVSITCDTSGATIYYTTDGSYPSTNAATYSGAVTISRSSTLVAIARVSGDTDSLVTYGNYYISSVPDSFIYNVAGNNFWGFSGDGGPATQADLNYPEGLAVDGSGNLYVADTTNNVIRKIDTSNGNISTIAGTGIGGYSGDKGSAVDAQLWNPTGLAFDSAGNLYIADNYNDVIRKIDVSSGAITTIAGDPSSNVLGDGGPATSALLIGPHAIAFDSSNNLYIADAGGNRVREVDAKTQIITTVAGGGNLPYGQYGDGGPATSATLTGPESLALDAAANIYIADTWDYVIRKVTRSTGIINTVAGIIGQDYQYSGDGGPATSAHLNAPQSIAFDSSGGLYIADTNNYRIRKVDASTNIINTIAGNGSCSAYSADGSPATIAATCEPTGLVFDGKGNLYFSNWGLNTVKVITPAAPPGTPTAAPVFSVPAGTYATPQTLILSDPTPGASIYVMVNGVLNPNSPTLTTDSTGYSGPIPIDGNVTITAVAVAPGHIPSDTITASYTITQPPNAIISTVAGSGTPGFSGVGGPATSAQIVNPQGITVDLSGNLYIADCGGVVWKVDSASGIISIVAGPGATGPAGNATFSCPQAVAVDKSGNIFIADTYNNVVREVQPATGNIVVYAGGGTGFNNGDGGPANQARLNTPTGLAFDSKSNLYIGEYNGVRKVDKTSNIITTVAENDTCCSGENLGDGGPATSAEVNPRAITFDASDNMFIADLYHGRIRRVDATTDIITTVAGDGDVGESGNGLLALQAEVEPYSIAVDPEGNIYLGALRQVRKVDASTGVISAAVGIGYSGSSGDGGSPLAATMCSNYGLALDAAGDLYLSDICGASVRKVTFNAPAPAPTFDPPAGTYTSAQSVTISDTAPNSTIYYTTDGSTPTNKSTQFNGAITVSGTETINAIAVSSGYAQSPVGSAAYTIRPLNTPAIALTSSHNPSVVAQSVTFTTTVSSPAGTPAGTVVFFDGTTQLGSGTLASGVATYATTALAAGAHSITAQYSGDANFAPVTSAALAQTVNTFGIGPASGAPTTASGGPGSIATYALSVTPPASTAVTFSVTGLPAGFSSSFSPNSVAAGAGVTQVELIINIPAKAASAAVPAKPGSASRLPLAFGLVLLPLVGLGRRIRRSRFLFLAVLALAGIIASAGLSGCSHNFNSGSTGNPPPPGTYTLTVTATAGTQTQSTTLTLNVQ